MPCCSTDNGKVDLRYGFGYDREDATTCRMTYRSGCTETAFVSGVEADRSMDCRLTAEAGAANRQQTWTCLLVRSVVERATADG